MDAESANTIAEALNRLLLEACSTPLSADEAMRFQVYISLFVRWNARTNLSSVREPGEILSRHIVESIVCARALPAGISSLLDFGSGGGLPGIPIAICRPEIAVTLAESQGKKAAFLHEAVRVLGVSTSVFADRAEKIADRFDCVVLRAVDRMATAVSMAAQLLNPRGWLALMTTAADTPSLLLAAGVPFEKPLMVPLPRSEERLLVMARRSN